jgi:hypothetical protein
MKMLLFALAMNLNECFLLLYGIGSALDLWTVILTH